MVTTLEKLMESLKSKHKLLLPTNKEIFPVCDCRKNFGVLPKRSLVDSVHNEISETTVRLEDTSHKWGEEEISELAHYSKHNNKTKRAVVRCW